MAILQQLGFDTLRVAGRQVFKTALTILELRDRAGWRNERRSSRTILVARLTTICVCPRWSAVRAYSRWPKVTWTCAEIRSTIR